MFGVIARPVSCGGDGVPPDLPNSLRVGKLTWDAARLGLIANGLVRVRVLVQQFQRVLGHDVSLRDFGVCIVVQGLVRGPEPDKGVFRRHGKICNSAGTAVTLRWAT